MIFTQVEHTVKIGCIMYEIHFSETQEHISRQMSRAANNVRTNTLYSQFITYLKYIITTQLNNVIQASVLLLTYLTLIIHNEKTN